MIRLTLALLLLGGAMAGARAAELTVTVRNIHSDRGDIRLSVYASAAEWPDKSTDEHDRVERARRGSVVFRFDLAPGVYAINGFHDENGNGKFDTSLLGLPEEGYCFSNDVRPFLSAPSFASASFTLPPEGTAITIDMQY